MQGIDWKLYQEDPFYRDLVDRMLENEQEAARLRQQLRAEQAQLDAEATYRRQRMLGYANQLPYRETTLLPHNPLCNLVPLCRTRKNSVMCSILR